MAGWLGISEKSDSGSGARSTTFTTADLPAGWTDGSEIVVVWWGNVNSIVATVSAGWDTLSFVAPITSLSGVQLVVRGTAADLPLTLSWTYTGADTAYSVANVFTSGYQAYVSQPKRGQTGAGTDYFGSYEIDRPVALFVQRFNYADFPGPLTVVNEYSWTNNTALSPHYRYVSCTRELAVGTPPTTVNTPHYRGYFSGSGAYWLGALIRLTQTAGWYTGPLVTG